MNLMRDYGSEVSDVVLPPRKMNVQKASIIRQFRRWNPNFFDYFQFINGSWQPKLGREGELARRVLARKQASDCRKKDKPLSETTAKMMTMAASTSTKGSIHINNVDSC